MKVKTESSSAAEPKEHPKPSMGFAWIGRDLVWIGGIATLTLVLGVGGLIFYGYQAKAGWVGVSDKKFWDFLELLIVPVVLAIGVAWLDWARRRHQAWAQGQREATEGARREHELEIENQRAQNAALQAYFEQMSQLLTDRDRPLRQSKEGDDARVLAWARTVTVLTRLDGERKGRVLKFLYESGLIIKGNVVVDLGRADLNDRADLSETQLSAAFLRKADLSATDLRNSRLSAAVLSEADLSTANLGKADLSEASLSEVDLHGANLSEADLGAANLSRAYLGGAYLRRAYLGAANLSKADLSKADLREATLNAASLHDADLRGANLQEAKYNWADLRRANLTNATMPNGQKYEEWLKSHTDGRGGDGENSGLS